jgi:DNA-binding response OmpR family regulator
LDRYVDALRTHRVVHDTSPSLACALEDLAFISYDAAVIVVDTEAIGWSDVGKVRRRHHTLSIVAVRDGTTAIERAAALDNGADDVQELSADPLELVRRLEAIVHRRHGVSSPVLQFGLLTLDLASKRAVYCDQIIPFSLQEFRLLELLVMRQGTFVSEDDLRDHVMEHPSTASGRIVPVAVWRMRRKLQATGIAIDPIHTQTGYGYAFMMEDHMAPARRAQR